MTRRTAWVDLNADLGEGCSHDFELLNWISSANVCCGAHAGDPESIAATLEAAAQREVRIGAHPGFSDRLNFGRLEMPIDTNDARSLVLTQFADLQSLAFKVGSRLRYLKPHGALYNQANRDPEIARGILQAAVELEVPLVGLPDSALSREAEREGHPYIEEGFPDRRYLPEGQLVSRSQPDAILHEPMEIEDQVLSLVGRGLRTLCIHGDDPNAVELVRRVRGVLERHQVEIRGFV